MIEKGEKLIPFGPEEKKGGEVRTGNGSGGQGERGREKLF